MADIGNGCAAGSRRSDDFSYERLSRSRKRGRSVVARTGKSDTLDRIRTAILPFFAAILFALTVATAVVVMVAGGVGMEIFAGDAVREETDINVAVVRTAVDIEAQEGNDIAHADKKRRKFYEIPVFHPRKITN